MTRIMAKKGNQSLIVLGLAAIVCLNVTQHSNAETPQNAVRTHSNQAPEFYWHTDLGSAWAEAHKRQLPMVIFITSERCHYCDAMKRDTWGDDSIRRQIAGRFVAVELKPNRNARSLARMEVSAYPTTLLGMPDGEIVAQRVGYKSPNEIHGLLAEVEPKRR